MGYLGYKPADKPLTAADITDSIITSAKIVDGTITNSDVASSIITGQTAETSIADADTLLIYDDSATALRKMTKANFVSGIGGTNTPAFYSYIGDISLTSGTTTKLSVTEVYDTDSAYDGTKFTVPSGKGGKYFFYVSGTLYATSSNATFAYYKIYKNNSLFREFELFGLSAFRNHNLTGTLNLDLVATDYIELYAQINGSGTTGTATLHFGGYKLVE
jgi:hypothetical protein